MLTSCAHLPRGGGASGLDDIIKRSNGSANVGVAVRSLNQQREIYARNAQQLFVPASNQKLLTTSAALLYLGPEFRFDTRLYTDARRVKGQRLRGNVYLKFSGDPSLDRLTLSRLVGRLQVFGVKQIMGDVVLAGDRRDAAPQAAGWMLDDVRYCYGTAVGAMVLDHNCVRLTVNPATRVGRPAIVDYSAKDNGVRVINKVVTRPKESCRVRIHVDKRNAINLKGCINPGAAARRVSVAIKDPKDYSSHILRSLFAKGGIQIQGKVRVGPLKKRLKLLATHHSPPLRALVATALKASDNLYTDALFLHLGAVYTRSSANWRNGRKAVTKILAQVPGLNLHQARLEDGSGLSRYNLVSPDQLVALLSYMYRHFPTAYEFVAGLPVAGADGTLSRRMQALGIAQQVRAKTGSMAGVSSLSGYLHTGSGDTLAFSILINGFVGSPNKYRRLEDAICRYLVRT